MRVMSQAIRSMFRLSLVLLATGAGWLLGSEQYGPRQNYQIHEDVNKAGIERVYASLFDTLARLHSISDPSVRSQEEGRVTDLLAGDPTLYGAQIDWRPVEAPAKITFSYRAVENTSSFCTMRSPAHRRAGLVRCSYDTAKGSLDILKFTRPIERRGDEWTLAVLEFDYKKLRKRLKEQ